MLISYHRQMLISYHRQMLISRLPNRCSQLNWFQMVPGPRHAGSRWYLAPGMLVPDGTWPQACWFWGFCGSLSYQLTYIGVPVFLNMCNGSADKTTFSRQSWFAMSPPHWKWPLHVVKSIWVVILRVTTMLDNWVAGQVCLLLVETMAALLHWTLQLTPSL